MIRRTYWKSYELDKLGVHKSTNRAIQRIQRKQIYADKKFEELKLKIRTLLNQSN